MSEDKKKLKMLKTDDTAIKNTIKDLDAALYNNGKEIATGRKENLLKRKNELKKLQSGLSPNDHALVVTALKNAKKLINS